MKNCAKNEKSPLRTDADADAYILTNLPSPYIDKYECKILMQNTEPFWNGEFFLKDTKMAATRVRAYVRT